MEPLKQTGKQKLDIELKKELELIEKNISLMFNEIKYAKTIEKAGSLKKETISVIDRLREQVSLLEKESLELEKENAILQQEISKMTIVQKGGENLMHL